MLRDARRFIIGAIALLLATVPALGRPNNPPDPALKPEACRFPVAAEVQSITRCYRLTVPRNYDQPSQGTFDLAVAVQKSTGPTAGRNPVLLLHGGPGGSGLAAAMGRRAARFSAGADTIVFDQRGNGLSDPATCNDIPSATREAIAAPGDSFTTIWRVNEPYARCRARLDRAAIRPEHFGTLITTRDAEQLRRALGVSRWDIMSVSYGTIVALDMMAANPSSIGAVVLDSPVGLVPHPETAAALFERPVLNIFAACSADRSCAAAYPRLPEEYHAILRGVDAKPLVVPLDPKASNGLSEANINGLELEFLLRRLMRSTTGIGAIPRTLQAARDRDVDAIRPLVTAAMAAVPESNTMGRPAVMCRDQAELSEVRLPTRGWDFGQLFGICRLWGAAGLAPRLPNRWRPPVLILIGGLDPYYEPAILRGLVRRLRPGARVLEFPAATHGVWSPGCSGAIVAKFYSDPASTIDPSCMEALPPINFVIPVTTQHSTN